MTKKGKYHESVVPEIGSPSAVDKDGNNIYTAKDSGINISKKQYPEAIFGFHGIRYANLSEQDLETLGFRIERDPTNQYHGDINYNSID